MVPFSMQTSDSSFITKGYLPDSVINWSEIGNTIEKCKSEGFNILLKLHVHSLYTGGATPTFWSGYIYSPTHFNIVSGIWDGISEFIKMGVDNVSIGNEIDQMVVFVDDWIWLKNKIQSIKSDLGVIYGGNGFQALREYYASQINSFIWWTNFINIFRWFGKIDPYKQIIDMLVSSGALGDQKIPEEMKSTLCVRLLAGRTKILNRYLEGCGLQFYYTPPMQDLNISSQDIYTKYSNYSVPILGNVNYIQCVKEYNAWGQDLWLTETSLIPPFVNGKHDLYPKWAEATIRAAIATNALILFLWSDTTSALNDEWLWSLSKIPKLWTSWR